MDDDLTHAHRAGSWTAHPWEIGVLDLGGGTIRSSSTPCGLRAKFLPVYQAGVILLKATPVNAEDRGGPQSRFEQLC